MVGHVFSFCDIGVPFLLCKFCCADDSRTFDGRHMLFFYFAKVLGVESCQVRRRRNGLRGIR